MTSRSSPTALLLVVLLAAGCADFERGSAAATPDAAAPGDAATPADGAALSFATNVSPLLGPCMRCHVPGQEAGDTKLLLTGNPSADYATVQMFIDTGAPSSSRLLAKMSGQGHEGGEVYAPDSPEYHTVLLWIQQGARP